MISNLRLMRPICLPFMRMPTDGASLAWKKLVKITSTQNILASSYSTAPVSESGIKYFELKESDNPETMDLLIKHFFPREPLMNGLHLSPEDISAFLDEGTDEYVDSGLSYGATCEETGQMVALRLGKFLTRENQSPFSNTPLFEDTPPKFTNLVSIMKTLEAGIGVFQDPEVNKVAEFAIICVNPRYSGRGIGKKLGLLTSERAEELGCQRAISQSSNFLTVKILSSIGYTPEKVFDYATLLVDGKQVLDLEAMKPSTEVKLMVKVLSPSTK